MSITATREIPTGDFDNRNTESGKKHHDGRTLRYLLPEEYPRWDELVEASPQGTVLCRSWWLKAASSDIRVLGYFNGGHLVAGIPLHFERRFGVRICRMPKLVHTWGVVMEPPVGKV